jgi:translational regulator
MSIVDTFVEVEPLDRPQFLKVKETLTRIGIGKDKTIFQSCHVLQKRGRYYITHYKELRILDGMESSFTDEDRARRNTIADLLEQWKLVVIRSPQSVLEPKIEGPLREKIKVIHFDEKKEWTLEPKYLIGKK